MPIRFRCPHCDQLMGIARRKAGSLVRCPSCQRETAVPANSQEEAPPPTPPELAPTSPKQDLFDRDDFDALLRGSTRGEGTRPATAHDRPATSTPAPPPPAGASLAEGIGRGPPPPAMPTMAPARGGIVLSPTWATLLTVAFILMMAVSFALGLLVGRYAL